MNKRLHIMLKVLCLFLIVLFSTLWLFVLSFYAPSIDNQRDELTFPSSLEELQMVYRILHKYSINNAFYAFSLFASAYLYKQAFCIPGSLFLNMLAGALYGHVYGLIIACSLTAIGASICYFISKYFIREFIHKVIPQRINEFERKVTENKDRLFYFMLFLRLVPVMPGWLVNLVSPLVGVPIQTFFVTALIGLGPYNFVGVSSGGMLASIKSLSDIFTWKSFINMAGIALVALVPAFILKRRHLDRSGIKSS